jgi:periplasmic protein CpxP/Spy
MKILKSLAVIAGLALVTATVSAQNQGGGAANMDPNARAQKMTADIKQNVTGITTDQESKILAAEQEFTKGMQDAYTSSNGDRDAMRSKMQPLKDARDTKIKAILTADQYAQYQKFEATQHQGGHRGGGGGN